jgi:hypothetical protein
MTWEGLGKLSNTKGRTKMIKLYNVKFHSRHGDETQTSQNLFRVADILMQHGCSANEFDRVSNLRVGETFQTNTFSVKRYA